MINTLKKLRIGYAPNSPDLSAPADRRRFVYYARARGLDFEFADPEKEYDILIVSCFTDITLWSRYRFKKTVIVFDLIDSYLAASQMNFKNVLRGTVKYLLRQHKYWETDYRTSLRKLLKRSNAAICCTEQQKTQIEEHCSPAHIILDVHSGSVKQKKSDYQTNDTFNIVWEGLAYNVNTLEALKNVINKVSKKHKIVMHVITDPEYHRHARRLGHISTYDEAKAIFTDVQIYSWNETTISAIATSCDLAVIPLREERPLEWGKPENKLLLFWKMGMPVLTSNTPAYKMAMTRAGLDMTCASESDWENKLLHYIENEAARKEAGEKALSFANSEYSEEITLKKWDDLMQCLIEKR